MSEKTSNSAVYFILGALVVAVLGIGYFLYSGQASGGNDLSITVSEDGIDADLPDN